MNIRSELNKIMRDIEDRELPASEAAQVMRQKVNALDMSSCIHYSDGGCSLIEVCQCTEAESI